MCCAQYQWYSWRNQLSALGDAGFCAWAPDLRGYNLTDKPHGVHAYRYDALTLDVEELLNAAGADQAVIVGHDWGGLVAWRFAMDYPERTAKLVILNVPNPAKARDGLRIPRQWLRIWYIGWFQLPYFPETLFAQNARLIARGLQRSSVRAGAFTDADVAVYARAIAQPGAMHAAINYYRALFRHGFWQPIKPIRVPTLMIWGENDFALGKALTYGTERYVSNLRMHYIPHCGHWVQNEAPDEVNEQLLAFLE